MSYQEPRPEREREREIIVTDTGRPGGGPGAVIAAVVGLIIVLLVGWFLLNMVGVFGTQGSEEGGTTDINVELPEGGGGDVGGDGGGDTGGGDTGGGG